MTETENMDPFVSCGNDFVDSDGGRINGSAGMNMLFAPTDIGLEDSTVHDVQQALLLRMDRMEQNMTFMLKRVFTEVITLRKENAILKAKVQEALDRNLEMKPQRSQSPVIDRQPQRTQSPVNEEEELLKCEVDEVSITERKVKTPRKVKGPKSAQANRKKPKLETIVPFSVIPEIPFTDEKEFLEFEQEISEDPEREQRLDSFHSNKSITEAESLNASSNVVKFDIVFERKEFEEITRVVSYKNRKTPKKWTTFKVGVWQKCILDKVLVATKTTCGIYMKRYDLSENAVKGSIDGYCRCGSKFLGLVHSNGKDAVTISCTIASGSGKGCGKMLENTNAT